MPVEVLMPELGQTSDEIVLVRWIKHEGEEVRQGEPLFEVETDKATMEVEATVTGVLAKILVGENEAVRSKTPVAIIARPDEMPLQFSSLPERRKPSGADTPRIQGAEAIEHASAVVERVKASPVARRLAEESGIDIGTLVGTGPDGRITKEDVLRAIGARESTPGRGAEKPPDDRVPQAEGQPLTGLRKLVAERMSRSKRDIPHFYVETEVEMTEAIKLRKTMNSARGEERARVSLTDLFVRAVAVALEEFPQLNALLLDDRLHFIRDINVGIAVGLNDGVIVPVIREANRKTLLQLAATSKSLITRARENKLAPDDIAGGTFTISNLGMYDVIRFTAIINPPQVAILAVGKAAARPVVREGELTVREVANLTLSCDHRAVDGVLAARFLERLKFLLENPYVLLLSDEERVAKP